MFGIGATLLALGLKFNIEDVWLLGAIFLGLVVLLFTVTSIAIAIPTYTTYRHRKRLERERLRQDKHCSFPDIHYERVETNHENSNVKLINSVLESLRKKEENGNSETDIHENNDENSETHIHENNEEQVRVEQVDVETEHIDILSTNSSSSSLLDESTNM